MSRWQWSQLIAFQLLWFVAVLGRNEWVVLGVLIVILHFLFSPLRGSDWQVIPIALIGMAVDSLFTFSGLFAFQSFPIWLGVLWIGFVLSLGHSLAWLHRLPRWTLAPIGAVTGTLSYIAGWKLQAVDFPQGYLLTAGALAVAWALILPTLVLLDHKIRRA